MRRRLDGASLRDTSGLGRVVAAGFSDGHAQIRNGVAAYCFVVACGPRFEDGQRSCHLVFAVYIVEQDHIVGQM